MLPFRHVCNMLELYVLKVIRLDIKHLLDSSSSGRLPKCTELKFFYIRHRSVSQRRRREGSCTLQADLQTRARKAFNKRGKHGRLASTRWSKNQHLLIIVVNVWKRLIVWPTVDLEEVTAHESKLALVLRGQLREINRAFGLRNHVL